MTISLKLCLTFFIGSIVTFILQHGTKDNEKLMNRYANANCCCFFATVVFALVTIWKA